MKDRMVFIKYNRLYKSYDIWLGFMDKFKKLAVIKPVELMCESVEWGMPLPTEPTLHISEEMVVSENLHHMIQDLVDELAICGFESKGRNHDEGELRAIMHHLEDLRTWGDAVNRITEGLKNVKTSLDILNNNVMSTQIKEVKEAIDKIKVEKTQDIIKTAKQHDRHTP